MLIDCHVNPLNREPSDFAAQVSAAGLDAVVVTQTNTAAGLDPFIEAIADTGLKAFAGLELRLERGALIFIPRQKNSAFVDHHWSPKGAYWTLETIQEEIASLDGVILGAHPYYRGEDKPLGDGIYRAKGLTAIAVRVGRGLSSWDRLAEQAASKRNLGRLGSCGGDVDYLGAATTVLPNLVDSQEALVDTLMQKTYMPLEFDDPQAPRDRQPPAPETARSPRRDDRSGPRRDGRSRGGRSRDQSSGRRRRD